MQSPCADAALDLPLWIFPNKALFLSRAINVKHIVTIVTVEKKIHLDREGGSELWTTQPVAEICAWAHGDSDGKEPLCRLCQDHRLRTGAGPGGSRRACQEHAAPVGPGLSSERRGHSLDRLQAFAVKNGLEASVSKLSREGKLSLGLWRPAVSVKAAGSVGGKRRASAGHAAPLGHGETGTICRWSKWVCQTGEPVQSKGGIGRI